MTSFKINILADVFPRIKNMMTPGGSLLIRIVVVLLDGKAFGRVQMGISFSYPMDFVSSFKFNFKILFMHLFQRKK